MTKLLIVSATEAEIQPVLIFLSPYKSPEPFSFVFGRLAIDVCITGVGMVNTSFELGRIDGENYDMAINAGVAGAFGDLNKGAIVNVTEDCFSEWGAEDGENFLRIDDLNFGKQKIEIENQLESFVSENLPKVRGITVNKVHGHQKSIEKIIASHGPDVESMEGAAFIHAANFYNWQAVQLRAISNKVKTRNKNNWDLPLAVQNLNATVIELIRELNGI
jgi:futalosine hydrolase